MASWQWSYPFSLADTATVLFDISPANAAYHWRGPVVDSPEPRQVEVRTFDGGTRAYEIGKEGRVIELSFENLPVGDDSTATQLRGYAGIVKFLRDSCGWSLRTFGHYDQDGSTELEVRYAGGIESFRRNADGTYSGTIRLSGVVV
jgi:hypothetical protein